MLNSSLEESQPSTLQTSMEDHASGSHESLMSTVQNAQDALSICQREIRLLGMCENGMENRQSTSHSGTEILPSASQSNESDGSVLGSHQDKSSEVAEEEDLDTFCFESDHLALRGNEDYTRHVRALSLLEAQKIQAVQDLETLLALQDTVRKDPMAVTERLKRGETLKVGGPQKIAELPRVNWSKYSGILPPVPKRPVTRLATGVVTMESGTFKTSKTNQPVSSQMTDAYGEKMKVRGRPFDETKPETFNQLWTSEEQRRLEELLLEFPPEEVEMRRWEKIANCLGNRTALQVQSRVQKYFLKLQRMGLPIPGKPKPCTVSHYRKRHNYFLYRPSTFFGACSYEHDGASAGTPSEPTVGSSPRQNTVSSSPQLESPAQETEGDPKSKSQSETLKQLQLLQQVKAELLREENALSSSSSSSPIQSASMEPGERLLEGFECDGCGASPLPGVRWHCYNCPSAPSPDMSIDFCSICVIHSRNAQDHWKHSLMAVREEDNNQSGFYPG